MQATLTEDDLINDIAFMFADARSARSLRAE